MSIKQFLSLSIFAAIVVISGSKIQSFLSSGESPQRETCSVLAFSSDY